MTQEEVKKLSEQVKELENLSDQNLIKKLAEYRQIALAGLTPHLIRRWVESRAMELSDALFQYFVDTKNQAELTYFIEAIHNEDFIEKRSELISILWQSSLDSTEYFEDLISIAVSGDYMTIIEVSTVIESYDTGFEEQAILDATYQLSDAIDEEGDIERKKLLENLRQVINELYSI